MKRHVKWDVLRYKHCTTNNKWIEVQSSFLTFETALTKELSTNGFY